MMLILGKSKIKQSLLVLLLFIVCFTTFLSCKKDSSPARSKKQPTAKQFQQPNSKWKILHIMSYHSPWKWTDDQFNGFKTALTGLKVEYKIFQMDTKNNSSKAWKIKASLKLSKSLTGRNR